MQKCPNPGVNRSAKQQCCLVPVALRAPAPGYAERSPGRFASGRTRQLSRELLPAATRRENKELKTDAPSGHGLAAALGSQKDWVCSGQIKRV